MTTPFSVEEKRKSNMSSQMDFYLSTKPKNPPEKSEGTENKQRFPLRTFKTSMNLIFNDHDSPSIPNRLELDFREKRVPHSQGRSRVPLSRKNSLKANSLMLMQKFKRAFKSSRRFASSRK